MNRPSGPVTVCCSTPLVPSTLTDAPETDTARFVPDDSRHGGLGRRDGGESKRKSENQGCSHAREILARNARVLFTPGHGVAKLPLWGSNGRFWLWRSWSSAGAAVLAQQATFKSGTSIVAILSTVIDAQGRLVPNLEQEEFTILDNGKPQEITFFQNETQPFTVVVMLDFSASMTANLDLLKAATEQFILRMLPDDKGQVGAFSDKIEFSGTFTSDRDDLIGALKDLQFGNPTRLYDAIDASIDMLDEASGRPEDRRWCSPTATTPRAAAAWATCFRRPGSRKR